MVDLDVALKQILEAAERTTLAANHASVAATEASAAAMSATALVREQSEDVKLLTWSVRQLWLRVDPNGPPPPPDGWTPKVPIAPGDGPAIAEQVGELKEESKAIRAELAAQSKAMGVGAKGAAFLLSREGQKRIALTLTLVSAIVAGVSGLVNAVHGGQGVGQPTPAQQMRTP